MLRQPIVRKLNPYWVYLMYTGLESLAFSLIFTVNLVYQAETVGLSPLQLVLVGTVLEATVFIFEIPTGILADTHSRRLSVIIGYGVVGLGFLIEGTIATFAGVLAAQVVWGFGVTFIIGAGDAWIADEVGEERAGKLYLRRSQVGSAFSIIGIVLSVVIASGNIQGAIIAGGVLLVINSVLLLLFMPEDGFTPAPKEDRETWQAMAATLRESGKAIRRRPVLMTIILIAVIGGASSEGFDRLWTAHMLENFTLPQLGRLDPIVWFGIIGIVSALIGIGFTEVIRRRVKTDTHGTVVRALRWIQGLHILMILIFALSQHFVLALLAFWMIGPLRGLEYPLQAAWTNQGLDPKVRATMLSVMAQANALGQVTVGPAVGYIGNMAGLRAALTTAGLLLTPVLLLYSRTLQAGEGGAADELAVPEP